MTFDTRIIIFAKAPVSGFAKTRLIPALGEQGAADLALRLLQYAVQQALEAGLGPVELCVTPDTEHPVFESMATTRGVALSVQGDGDLGQRMHQAFERGLKVNRGVLLMGTDAPALNATVLLEARHKLQTHDAVFVPAFDGGYALIGLREPRACLFQGMAWSTSSVMQDTRDRARGQSMRWYELPPVHDIDEPHDLAHVPGQWQMHGRFCSVA